jgi:hypothetical protein
MEEEDFCSEKNCLNVAFNYCHKCFQDICSEHYDFCTGCQETFCETCIHDEHTVSCIDCYTIYDRIKRHFG